MQRALTHGSSTDTQCSEVTCRIHQQVTMNHDSSWHDFKQQWWGTDGAKTWGGTDMRMITLTSTWFKPSWRVGDGPTVFSGLTTASYYPWAPYWMELKCRDYLVEIYFSERDKKIVLKYRWKYCFAVVRSARILLPFTFLLYIKLGT